MLRAQAAPRDTSSRQAEAPSARRSGRPQANPLHLPDLGILSTMVGIDAQSAFLPPPSLSPAKQHPRQKVKCPPLGLRACQATRLQRSRHLVAGLRPHLEQPLEQGHWAVRHVQVEGAQEAAVQEGELLGRRGAGGRGLRLGQRGAGGRGLDTAGGCHYPASLAVGKRICNTRDKCAFRTLNARICQKEKNPGEHQNHLLFLHVA